MKRRQVVALLGGAAIAWPLVTHAQQKQPRLIGVLSQDLQPDLLETFRGQLQKLGYVEGQGVSHELRKIGGDVMNAFRHLQKSF